LVFAVFKTAKFSAKVSDWCKIRSFLI